MQVLADAAVIYLTLLAAFWVRFPSRYFESALAPEDYPVYFKVFGLIAVTIIYFLRKYGLYRSVRTLTYWVESLKVCKAVFVSFFVLTAITFFLRDFSFSRTFLVIAGFAVALVLSLSRVAIGLLLVWIDQKRGSLRNILILGCNDRSKKLVSFYKKNLRYGARVMGFLDDELPKNTEAEGVPVFGAVDELEEFLKYHREVHEVVLAIPGIASERALKVIYECEKRLIAFRWVTDIFGLITSKMSVVYTGGMPLLSFTDSPLGEWENRLLKRLMDIILSGTALILFTPVFLVLAILVKTDSPGPIFFRQQRIGEDGRRFFIYKFRTMRVGAEASTGPVWAKENDPRRTKLGAFLRSSNLDELPQFWNVLKGDMSLVGPRPERPFFVSQFKEDIPRYMARHSIRSGITGWAQVNGLRGNTSIEERTKFDLYYIENWSLVLDLKILFMTFFARRNAY
jgi:exopolysaccharide biosynthesis polyprenyl glycosylphosphotransferase